MSQVDNQWIGKFFKVVSKNCTGREYKCLTCGQIIGANDGHELSDKAVKHLKGNCHGN